MTDFKVGDEVEVLENAVEVPVGTKGIVENPCNNAGFVVVDGIGWRLFLPSELKLVKPEPKFKVGDWVKVHGRGDKWDGSVCVVTKLGYVGFSYGQFYEVEVKQGYRECVAGFFEKELEATDALPKFTAESVTPLKIYLAGPMSGIEHYNFPAFFTAARKLREAGHTVFNPAENDLATGFNALGMAGHEAADHGFSLRDALKTDLSWICENANAIALLDGWESSKGVKAELALADALGVETAHYAHYLKETAK